MTPTERDSVAAICLLAAFADGEPSAPERERMKSAFDRLSNAGSGAINPEVYQRVLLRQTDARREAANVTTPELRTLAYEIAAGVCSADGPSTDTERAFLSDLALALNIPIPAAAHTLDHVDLLADAPHEGASGAPPGAPTPPTSTAPDRDRQVDDSITNYAVLCAALELLPHSLASAAIIPLQTKMVYEIGKRYGYSLDRNSVTDFLGTVGIGVAAQMVEGLAGKLIGGLLESAAGHVLGHTLGRTIGGVGETATGAGFTFATTYALGQVAKQYYAGGRRLAAIDLQELFRKQTAAARTRYNDILPRIQEQARNFNPGQLLSMVRR